jgi:hypothetical protein
MGIFGTHRARPAGKTTDCPTAGRGRSYLSTTNVHIMSAHLHRPYRTSMQTGLGLATLARIGPVPRVGQSQLSRESQRTAIGMPEPKPAVNQNPERRGVQSQGAPCPALERPPGRSIKWIKGSALIPLSQCVDRSLRPAIEGVRLTVAMLRAVCKHGPVLIARETDEDHRADGPAVDISQGVAGFRMKSTTSGQSDGLELLAELVVGRLQSFNPRRFLYGNQSGCGPCISSTSNVLVVACARPRSTNGR